MEDLIHFIGYKDDKNIRPYCIFSPKVSTFRIDFDETECIHCMIKEENVLISTWTFWNKLAI